MCTWGDFIVPTWDRRGNTAQHPITGIPLSCHMSGWQSLYEPYVSILGTPCVKPFQPVGLQCFFESSHPKTDSVSKQNNKHMAASVLLLLLNMWATLSFRARNAKVDAVLVLYLYSGLLQLTVWKDILFGLWAVLSLQIDEKCKKNPDNPCKVKTLLPDT